MQIAVTVAHKHELNQVAQLYETVGYGGGVSPDDVTLIAKAGHCLIGAVRLCQETGFIVLRGMQVLPTYQRQGAGKILLAHCVPFLNRGHAFCLPYAYLTHFYGQIGFKLVMPDALPALMSHRLTGYIKTGQSVLAMGRVAGQVD